VQPTELNASAASALATAPAVLELAESSRWRAPEVTAALAEQAVRLAEAGGDQASALRAEGWLAHGLVAIGRGVAAVPRAVRALSDASKGHDLEAAGRLRVELAAVARALGDRDTAQALLAPVLEQADASHGLRADAHLEAARRGGAESPDGVLELVGVAAGALRQLGGEYAELGLAAVDAVLARQERERGHVNGAMERAREGLRRVLGGGSGDGALDPVSPHLAAELSLELTLALLDGGQTEAVREAARSVLRWGARPGVLVPVARLRLTLAQRVYLSAGEEDVALASAEWVSKAVESHDLPEIEVECHGLLAEILERRGELPFALAASRRAHEAYRLHAARVEQALVLLARSGSEAKLAAARRHPVRPRAQAGNGLSSHIAEAVTQINILASGARRTQRPGAGEPSAPRRPNPLDSGTQPSRQVPAPPPPGPVHRDPQRPESNHQQSAHRAPPASEAKTSSWFVSPNPLDSAGRPPARPFEGEPSGRRAPAVPPLLGASWRPPPGADPRQPTGAEQTGRVEARRQDGSERGRPSHPAPTEPIARPRSEPGPRRGPDDPRRGPDEQPRQSLTGSRSGNLASEPRFDIGRAPVPGEAVRRDPNAPGDIGQPLAFGEGSSPGGADGEIRPARRGSVAAGEPRRPGEQRPGEQRPGEQRPMEQRPMEQRPMEQRPMEQRPMEQSAAAGTESLAGLAESGLRWLGADSETVPGVPGSGYDRPAAPGPVHDPSPAAEHPGEGGKRRADETQSSAGHGRSPLAAPGDGLDDGSGAGGGRPEAADLGEREPGLRAWPGDARGGKRRAPEAGELAALSVPELAVKLAGLAGDTGQQPHLVLVDIVAPRDAAAGAAVAVLAARIGELVRDQLPAAARLYPLDQDAMAIGMPEADPEVVTRWVRSLSTALSRRWPELAVELPRAVFRIGVRWLGGALSVEQHVRELRAGRLGAPPIAPDQPAYPAGRPSYPPTQLAGRTGREPAGEPDSDGADAAASGGRHGAGFPDPEPSSTVAATHRVSALPGSGGRRRRADGTPDDGHAPATPTEHGAPRPTAAPASARWVEPAHGGDGGREVGVGAGGHGAPEYGGSPANGSRLNGASTNGHTANGYTGNGYSGNGHTADGHTGNGYSGNGHTANGHTANGHSGNGHSGNGHSGNGHSGNGHSGNGHSGNGHSGNGYSGNGHSGSLNSHAIPGNGHFAPTGIAVAGPAGGVAAEATARFAAGAGLGGEAGTSGDTGMPGRTALADPGAPARRHRDQLSAPGPIAAGADHDTRARQPAGEPEPNGVRPVNGLADTNDRANRRVNGGRRANGHHIPDAAGGDNGHGPGTSDGGREHNGSHASGRHAKPSTSTDALDATAGWSAEVAMSGEIGALGGAESLGTAGLSGDAEARSSTAAGEPARDVGAGPARRPAREEAPPAAFQDASGRSVSELSFAELLAGALEAYREA
jgi:hypothetical protein